ncbi:phage tail protein [uncultured Acinetobacter sp.]|uniref:phage tail-collar fiber domain-containing protein n=1 Tax=uncultured Acinetobacter sp. TaxID=165433 RepID=UPI00261E8F47|nr:phage tail protein [uncultured Acinetobacter sp.]
MAEYYNVTTNLGDAEIANAIATNTKLNITHIAFGDGNGSVPTPNKARTFLVREVHRQAVTKYERHPTNANWIVIETIIPSDVGGFTIREMGIIANEKLISHGSHAPFEKVADPSGVSEYRLRFTQNVTDGSVVELTLDESLIYATQAWIDENYIKRSEIVDDLTTNDSAKVLSAAQGKVLNEKITNIPVYSLPTASTTTKGGVKVGTGLSVANEVLSVSLNNTLTSTSNTQALTAAQGKILGDSLDILNYCPIAYPKSTPPTGYLAMMGQAISQATYPKLYALYGPKLPDLRAYSIRGLDYGRGIDTDRVVLSEQDDAIKSHSHPTWNRNVNIQTATGAGHFSVTAGQTGSTGAVGSTETRVKNIAFLYIVKAG